MVEVLEKKEEERKEHSKFRNEKEGQRRAITPSVLAPSMSFRSFGSGAFDMGLDVRWCVLRSTIVYRINLCLSYVPSGFRIGYLHHTANWIWGSGPTLGLPTTVDRPIVGAHSRAWPILKAAVLNRDENVSACSPCWHAALNDWIYLWLHANVGREPSTRAHISLVASKRWFKEGKYFFLLSECPVSIFPLVIPLVWWSS